MKKKHLAHWVLLTLFFCICLHFEAFGGPLPVSPVSEKGVAKVATRCPTFSWAQEQGASAYGLEVYELKYEQVPTRQEAITQWQPVISKRIPAPALSWTPTTDMCLEAGKRYVWFVNAEYENGTNEWSEGKVFETQKAPDLVGTMVEQEVRKYMESEGLDYWIAGTGLSGDTSLVEKKARDRAAAISGKDTGRNDSSRSQGLKPLAYEGYQNVFYGQNAGHDTTGDDEFCTFIGGSAGYSNGDSQGFANTYVGYASGLTNTGSDYNTFLGYMSGYYATGEQNTLVGALAGTGTYSHHFTGSRNVFAGYQSGYSTTSGHDNVFLGHASGYSNQNGDYDIFIGRGAGYHNTSGDSNVFIGYYGGYSNQDGFNNTFVGSYSGYYNQGGYLNTFLGSYSGLNNTSGFHNVFIGYSSGNSTTSGSYNTFLGSYSGTENTNGTNNLFAGYHSGFFNTSGHHNAFLGDSSGENNSYGYQNTFVGTFSGNRNTSGYNNVAIGYRAGYFNQIGHGNVFLGSYAGYNETGSNNLYIDNSDTINPLIYGDFYSDTLTVHGKLGINTKTPQADLDLNGGTLTVNGTDTSAGGSRLPKLAHIETGRFDAGWGGAGGGNLEFYSLGHSRAGQFRFVYGGGDFGQIQFIHYDGSNWTNYMTLTKDGHLNMLPDGSTVRAYCDGYSWHDSSSRQFKKEIRKLDSDKAFSAFTALEPVTYKYKGTDELRVGFIAEDVPELVATKDRKSLVAMDIVAVLTKVVQEQEKEIEARSAKIKALEKKIEAVSLRLQNFERACRIKNTIAMESH